MNSSFTYPAVSYRDIINLVHAILFWRYEEKYTQGIHSRYWFITFNTVWVLLELGKILPKSRIKRLRGKRELCALFLKQTFVVEQWDSRGIDIILESGAFKRFYIRKGNRELVAGNTVNRLELCTRTRVFITPFGIRTAPTSAEEVAHLLTRETFLQLWERYTAPYREDKSALGMRMKIRNKKLDEEIWSKRDEGNDTMA